MYEHDFVGDLGGVNEERARSVKCRWDRGTRYTKGSQNILCMLSSLRFINFFMAQTTTQVSTILFANSSAGQGAHKKLRDGLLNVAKLYDTQIIKKS